MEVVNEEKHVSCVKLSEFESTRVRVSWITYLKSSLEIGSEVIEIGLKTLKLSPLAFITTNNLKDKI
jgi:hypothetical protein